MKKNNRFVKSCLVVALLLALAAIAILIAFLFMRKVQNTRIAANLPPTVLVNMPVNGESVPAGETVEVSWSQPQPNTRSRTSNYGLTAYWLKRKCRIPHRGKSLLFTPSAIFRSLKERIYFRPVQWMPTGWLGRACPSLSRETRCPKQWTSPSKKGRPCKTSPMPPAAMGIFKRDQPRAGRWSASRWKQGDHSCARRQQPTRRQWAGRPAACSVTITASYSIPAAAKRNHHAADFRTAH